MRPPALGIEVRKLFAARKPNNEVVMGGALADLVARLAGLGFHDPQVTQLEAATVRPLTHVIEALGHVRAPPVVCTRIGKGEHPGCACIALTEHLGTEPEVFAKPGAPRLKAFDFDRVRERIRDF
jgi:hypothetical protein